tara:strand:- start:634 stop:1098 length:465 start_codon:yes stop_codon:yes gene_type:complete
MAMQSQHVWWTERGAIWIAHYNPRLSEKDQFTSPSDSSKDVHIYYYKKADPFKFEGQSVDDRSVVSGLYLNATTSGTAGTYKVGTDFLNQRSEIPEQYHEYLVDRAIQLGHEKKGQLDFAQYYRQKFEVGVKLGKRFAYQARTGEPARIQPVDF